MNLSLEGHSGQLQVATWNEVYQKLTTSDEHGVIIVWMLYKGSWYEEMINNRNKSTVRGMAWSSDGQRICIAYEDGAVIVGSVDGSRVWGKDLKGPGLTAVQWSPDNTLLLFALPGGELHLYDNQGTFALAISNKWDTLMEVVGLDWYSGKAPAGRPLLAVCYKNGTIQLMKTYSDEAVIIVETKMYAIDCRWNHNGTTLAVAGTIKDETNAIQFFNPYGEHLRTLRVPGGSMKAISWEGRSLRLAIAVDSFIYFANVKPDHKYAYYGNTLAFCSEADTITFWDTSTHQTWVNHIPGVVDMCGVEEYCVLATSNTLVISNQQGIQCDAKQLTIPIMYVVMNSKGTVVAASKDCFVVWKFSTPTKQGTTEQTFNADGSNVLSGDVATTEDAICCIACSDSHLFVGRESGLLISFSLLSLKRISTLNMGTRPYKMEVNCNSSKLFVIDSSGSLYLLDTDMASNISIGQPVKRDVWRAAWARDNPQLLAAAEKARLYVLRGSEPEEPLTAHGYLCKFQNLEITSALLDDITDKCSEQHIVKAEVKSLRDTRQLLDKVGLKEAEIFIRDNPHPHLWLLLAEAALRKLDSEGALETAEAAFVRRGDYAGVRFIRRLTALHSPELRKAEILTYFKDFDGAEKIYLEEDRRDLAIALRRRLGHWFRVVELLKMSANTTESQVTEAYKEIGDYYMDRQNWSNAVDYYKMANYTDGLSKCYIALEDTESLAKMYTHSPRKIKDDIAKSQIETDTYDVSQLPPSVAGIMQLKDNGRMLQAAQMALQLATSEASKKSSPLKVKKLYVLAGHIYSQNSVEGGGSREAARCWRLAGAQHWLALAAARAQARPFRADAALRAAARLHTALHFLHNAQHLQAWCTIALIAAESRAFDMCSKAFMKLEAMEDDGAFADLAIDIFTRHSPHDAKGSRVDCPTCGISLPDWTTSCVGCESEFPGCAATGRALHEPGTVWTCATCAHHAARHELVLRHSCPMCHAHTN